MSAAELVERGRRAFNEGRREEARRCWGEALALDPGNEQVRAYLLNLAAVPAPSATLPRPGAPVPLPGPAQGEAEPRRPRSERAEASAPVPLPAPERDWLRSPVTLPPTGSPLHAEGSLAAAPSAPSSDPFAPPPPERDTLSDYAPSPWGQGPTEPPPVVLAEGGGLDLSSVDEQSGIRPLVPQGGPARGPSGVPGGPNEIEVWMQGARELFALGDFSGSLELIERILKLQPGHAEAREYLQQNESTLIAMYESKLGPPGAIPRLAIQPEEVMWLNLDHRAGFLLAQIDGTVNYEDLFALSGLPRLDTARILAALLQQGVIS
ncbi:MAG TPA: tetratricopeptide repeat protein [Anaeromyxobacteraceae bacterium]|nr:tetratricopeptide repeat protein [Anaeromyxobacteraceae bacterium]